MFNQPLGDRKALKPEKNVDLERLRTAFREYDERLARLSTMEPEPCELAKVYLEEEFEEREPLSTTIF